MGNDLRDKLKGTHCNETSDIDDATHAVTRTFVSELIALPAAGLYNIALMKADTNITLVSAAIIPAIALTADNTDYRILTLSKGDEAATSLTDFDKLETKATGTDDWVSMTALPFTIVESTDVLVKGDVLYLEATVGNSSVIILGCSIRVKYRLTN